MCYFILKMKTGIKWRTWPQTFINEYALEEEEEDLKNNLFYFRN